MRLLVVFAAVLLLAGCGAPQSPECAYIDKLMDWLERSETALNDGMMHLTRPTLLQEDYEAASTVVDEIETGAAPQTMTDTTAVVQFAARSVVNSFAGLDGKDGAQQASFALSELTRAVDGVSQLRQNYGCK